MTKANFGVVGMAVMGRNLALNIESRGYTVAIYNRSKEKQKIFVACHPEETLCQYDIESFAQSEKTTSYHAHGSSRDPVLTQPSKPLTHLDKGDILIDGETLSIRYHPVVTRRVGELRVNFIGTGVSGGKKGARRSASAWWAKEAYDLS